MDIILNPALDAMPRMIVSSRFAELMPGDFVADLNAWMKEFFGVSEPQILSYEGRLYMGPKMFEEVKRRINDFHQ
jgi:hypothetical protein